MAAETEGIALLSMYGDDEDEEEATVTAKVEEVLIIVPAEGNNVAEYRNEFPKDNFNKREHSPGLITYKSSHPFTSPSPLHPLDGSELKTLNSPFLHRTPTPQPPAYRSQLSSPLSSTSPVPSPAPARLYNMPEYPDVRRSRRALAIVDYAQDETAMSPELDVMEIETFGRVVFGEELHISDGKNIERTPASSQSLTPFSQQEHVPPFQDHDQSKFEANMIMDFTRLESGVAEIKDSASVFTDIQIDKTMQSFLPPTVTTKCPEELQEKINKFLAYKRAGKSFNTDLRNRKDYRNPNFLQHAMSYQDIDEIGTCFSKEVFDPHGYDKSDFYDVIEADLKRELERKEQERKKSPKIDFVSGCSQSGGVAPVLKANTHIPAAGISSLPPNPITMDSARDGRINKKSKWDKIDGDAKALLSSGHDNPPTSANVNASHLSAANAGTGYSAFAQLKRREAEEKKSSERKFDKRS